MMRRGLSPLGVPMRALFLLVSTFAFVSFARVAKISMAPSVTAAVVIAKSTADVWPPATSTAWTMPRGGRAPTCVRPICRAVTRAG